MSGPPSADVADTAASERANGAPATMTAAQGSSLVDSATLRDSDDMDYEPTTENDESEDEDEEVEGEEHDDDDEYVDENVNGAYGNLVRVATATAQDMHHGREEIPEDFGEDNDWMYLVPYLSDRRLHGSDADNEDARPRRTPAQDQRESTSNYPPIPNEAGVELMHSGTYGARDAYPSRSRPGKARLSPRLLARELGVGSVGRRRAINSLIAQDTIPSSKADLTIRYTERGYSGQFSGDGNFFYCCAQDFRVRLYDTSNPHRWSLYKKVLYPYGSWTITDASLSPDNRFLAYSSIRNVVCLAPTDRDDSDEPYLMDLATRRHRGDHSSSFGTFGIWSICFSDQGHEILAGTSNNSVIAYDLETRQSVSRIDGHEGDVNAVCYGDKASPHIVYSGSDDSTIKVWDRRSMTDGREAGVFLGHNEGITSIDSKRDGRYVLSNSKDQSMKLWDLRKMSTKDDYDGVRSSLRRSRFDYRYMDYDPADHKPNPRDTSLVTFRGHRVLKTLIRCHFSPPSSTDSRYVFSGSEDGAVYIYNLDGTVAGKIDVLQATGGTHSRRPRRGMTPGHFLTEGAEAGACVRDASWHPHAPIIAATSWNGNGLARGSCTVHSWADGAVDDEGDPPTVIGICSDLEMELGEGDEGED